MSTLKNIRNRSYQVINIDVNAGDGTGDDWHVYGNTNTDPSVNFVGTTDNQPLILATNGDVAIYAIRINTKGAIEPLSGDVKLGLGAGASTGISGGVFIGAGAGAQFTATEPIMIGKNAGAALLGNEPNTICIGGAVLAGLSQEGAQARIFIGEFGTHQQTFIQGIAGNTPGGSVGVTCNAFGALGALVSSIRYKNNIEDMGDKSSFIYNLRPVTFNYNNLPDEKSYGLIAEEVYDICPDIVVKNPKGEIESVQLQYLPPMILNELQKQKKIIDDLVQRITSLENK